MSSVCKGEKFLGRGQRLFWLESSSGPVFSREKSYLFTAQGSSASLEQRFIQHRDDNTVSLIPEQGTVSAAVQVSHWSTSPQKRCCCFLCTVWGAHRGKRGPWLISHHSLLLSCLFTRSFSQSLFCPALGPTLKPVFTSASSMAWKVRSDRLRRCIIRRCIILST